MRSALPFQFRWCAITRPYADYIVERNSISYPTR
jgi:hypothetical protein